MLGWREDEERNEEVKKKEKEEEERERRMKIKKERFHRDLVAAKASASYMSQTLSSFLLLSCSSSSSLLKSLSDVFDFFLLRARGDIA